MDFGKKVIETPTEEGLHTREEGYFNGLNTVKETTRQDIAVNRDTILTELIRCLDLMKTTTNEITIRIAKDKYGEPELLQKTWVISREKIK